jgi:predicted RNA-binding protein with PUA-like domain
MTLSFEMKEYGNILLPMNYWLVKQEPADYSWSQFVKDGTTSWTGVRNFQARNYLRGMKKGDQVFFYHSGEGKEVVGIASVKKEAYPDPTADEGDWAAVDLVPVKPLNKSVPLAVIKNDPQLKNLLLVRQSRLSVMPVTDMEFSRIIKLADV